MIHRTAYDDRCLLQPFFRGRDCCLQNLRYIFLRIFGDPLMICFFGPLFFLTLLKLREGMKALGVERMVNNSRKSLFFGDIFFFLQL